MLARDTKAGLTSEGFTSPLLANLATRRVVGDPAAGRFATPPVSARLATHGRRLNPRVEILATSTHESTRARMRNRAARATMLA